jgi:hypothetical protein
MTNAERSVNISPRLGSDGIKPAIIDGQNMCQSPQSIERLSWPCLSPCGETLRGKPTAIEPILLAEPKIEYDQALVFSPDSAQPAR